MKHPVDNSEFSLWQKKRGTIVVIVAAFLVLGTVFTFVQEFRYESRSKVLLIQNFPSGTDPYKASKSNEFLANVLASVIKTNTFYQEVMNAGFNINQSYFGEEVDGQLKAWTRSLSVDVINDSGIIDIRVYHPERSQADQISRAVNFTLRSKHQEYHGMSDDISLRVIDQPLTSRRPVKPNVPVNLGLSLLFGLALSLAYLYLFPDADDEPSAHIEEKIVYSEPTSEIKELEKPAPDPSHAREHLSHRQVEYFQNISARQTPEAVGQVLEADDLDAPRSIYTREAEMKEISLNELRQKANIRNVLTR